MQVRLYVIPWQCGRVSIHRTHAPDRTCYAPILAPAWTPGAGLEDRLAVIPQVQPAGLDVRAYLHQDPSGLLDSL
jgi:hypothetical protein